jgi:hypothetical protein
MSALEQALGRPAIEVVAKAKRRQFTVEYKRKIVREADGCKTPGAIGALLRGEGLYSSHLTTWRAARDRGELARAPKKRGPARRVVDPRDKKLAAQDSLVVGGLPISALSGLLPSALTPLTGDAAYPILPPPFARAIHHDAPGATGSKSPGLAGCVMVRAILTSLCLLITFIVPTYGADVDPQSLVGEWEGRWQSRGREAGGVAGQYYLTIKKVEGDRVFARFLIYGARQIDIEREGTLQGNTIIFESPQNKGVFTVEGDKMRGIAQSKNDECRSGDQPQS